MRNVLLLELISRELVSRDNSSDSIACVPINVRIIPNCNNITKDNLKV